MRNAIRTVAATMLLCCHMQAAVSATPRLYDVEVIIFSHMDADDQGETWPVQDNEVIRGGGVFTQDQFTELSGASHTLNAARLSLQQSRNYQVLFHRAWRLLASDSTNAVDYPVYSFAEDNRSSIEGTIRLLRGRYLHLDVDLLLMEATANLPRLFSAGPVITPTFRLAEKRRIKSSELHYFDHPRFGMLAMVTPYEPPEEIVPEELPEQDNTTEETIAETPAAPVDDQLTR